MKINNTTTKIAQLSHHHPPPGLFTIGTWLGSAFDGTVLKSRKIRREQNNYYKKMLKERKKLLAKIKI